MCKVLIVPNIKDTKRNLTTRFIRNMAQRMSLANSDGLGYAGINKDGVLSAERWLNNAQGFTYGGTHVPTTNVFSMFGEGVKESKPETIDYVVPYTKHGEPDFNSLSAITLHARYATCEKSLANVHPFIKNDTSVIHNGVIRNVEKFKLELSTCDSEAILQGYLANGVGGNTGAVPAMVSEFIGYYVAAMFSRDAEGNRVLDVFNGNNTNLYVANIKELDTYVMSTSDFDIKNACGDLNLTILELYQMKDDQFFRINPFTGDVIEHSSFRSGSQYETTKTNYQATDYTYNNWKEYKADANTTTLNKGNNSKGKNKPISESELDYLTKRPKISMLNEQEALEELRTLQLVGA